MKLVYNPRPDDPTEFREIELDLVECIKPWSQKSMYIICKDGRSFVAFGDVLFS